MNAFEIKNCNDRPALLIAIGKAMYSQGNGPGYSKRLENFIRKAKARLSKLD